MRYARAPGWAFIGMAWAAIMACGASGESAAPSAPAPVLPAVEGEAPTSAEPAVHRGTWGMFRWTDGHRYPAIVVTNQPHGALEVTWATGSTDIIASEEYRADTLAAGVAVELPGGVAATVTRRVGPAFQVQMSDAARWVNAAAIRVAGDAPLTGAPAAACEVVLVPWNDGFSYPAVVVETDGDRSHVVYLSYDDEWKPTASLVPVVSRVGTAFQEVPPEGSLTPEAMELAREAQTATLRPVTLLEVVGYVARVRQADGSETWNALRNLKQPTSRPR